MPTARSLHDQLVNALDFLTEMGLGLYATQLSLTHGRVGWHTTGSAPFGFSEPHATVGQYLDWVSNGHYSLLLTDASLLQMSYQFDGAEVTGHRLAYVPCPVRIDKELLAAGESVADIVDAQLSDGSDSTIQLQSVIRFDYAPGDAGGAHPAAHLTLNSTACRIACVAALHPYRFMDFVFRNFYPALHASQPRWFAVAAERRLGTRVITDDHTERPHMAWAVY
jgi:hypothetical protein